MELEKETNISLWALMQTSNERTANPTKVWISQKSVLEILNRVKTIMSDSKTNQDSVDYLIQKVMAK